MRFVLTPQAFFDLFITCLYWMRREGSWKVSEGWTTVDKVVRVLHGLDLVTVKQRKAISRDRRTQSLFVMKTEFLTFGHFDGGSLLTSSKLLVIPEDAHNDLNRERMLRNMRVYLTDRGRDYARSIESRQPITSEVYLEEERRQESLLSDAAKPTVTDRYRLRVERETGKEEQ